MFKRGLVVVGAMGFLGALIGGGVIAYSQISGDGSGGAIFRRASEAAKTPQFEPVVARVNGRQILGEEIALKMALDAESVKAMPELGRIQTPPTPRGILDSFVNFELAYQEAERRGLLCSNEEVRSLAEAQLQSVRQAEGGADFLQVWADHLGISVGELTTNPRALKPYAEICARGRLAHALAPPDALGDPEKMEQFWDELYASLRRSATIEILDPTLR